MRAIHDNYSKIADSLSSYPLCFCHGDMKSPNVLYKDNREPYFLDWQYIHLNKGVSDIVFLLVESVDYNSHVAVVVEKLYFQLLSEKDASYTYDAYLKDFRCALCMFPFFVCVWFNSEDFEKLLDKTFPMRFMKKLLCYYSQYLTMEFFDQL